MLFHETINIIKAPIIRISLILHLSLLPISPNTIDTREKENNLTSREKEQIKHN